MGISLDRLTPQRKLQGGTDLVHARSGEVSHALSDQLLQNRCGVMQVHDAVSFQAVGLVEHDLGCDTAGRRRDGRNGYGGKVWDAAVSREHENGPGFIGSGELV